MNRRCEDSKPSRRAMASRNVPAGSCSPLKAAVRGTDRGGSGCAFGFGEIGPPSASSDVQGMIENGRWDPTEASRNRKRRIDDSQSANTIRTWPNAFV